jgi:hypothetical protein
MKCHIINFNKNIIYNKNLIARFNIFNNIIDQID